MTDNNIPDPIERPEEYADFLFDEVSGTLRDRPEPGPWADLPSRATKADLRAALDEARTDFLSLRRDLVHSDSVFDALHLWIVQGLPLPDPWRKRYVPRKEAEGVQAESPNVRKDEDG